MHLKGTGLGLPICNTLVDMMGGQIDLVSEPGIGSEFSFTLAVREQE
jgi:two-component system capsular synthesis sensor histidine kinase RcsC